MCVLLPHQLHHLEVSFVVRLRTRIRIQRHGVLLLRGVDHVVVGHRADVRLLRVVFKERVRARDVPLPHGSVLPLHVVAKNGR